MTINITFIIYIAIANKTHESSDQLRGKLNCVFKVLLSDAHTRFGRRVYENTVQTILTHTHVILKMK